ncbi:MAG: dolichol kinase [Leptospiraceae bacterium]|nr:MAG: dolichol kinase [Leptospiraceae bacterium]
MEQKQILQDKKAKFNLKRKLWHLLGLIIPLLLYLDIFRFIEPENPHITRYIGMWLILGFLIFLILIEIIRLNYEPFNQFFIRVCGPLLKENEYHQMHGSISYIFANFILFLFFTKEIITLSSLILMICDPIAAYIGIFYGKRKFKNGKSIEGFIAFFISSFIVSIAFLGLITLFHIGSGELFLSKLNFFKVTIILSISSLFCSLIEFFSFTTLNGLIDDNLTIPLGAAFILSILFYLFGFPLEAVFSPLI